MMAAALLGSASTAAAQEVTVGVGLNGRISDNDPNAAVGLDLTFGDLAQIWRLQLGLGAALAVNSDGDLWGGAGPVLWLDLGEGWRAEGSVMAGLYADKVEDLGGPVQFHSRLGISYALTTAWRLGASVGHSSNAGLYDENPGIERVMLTLTHKL
jgi:hypothetical protein